MAMIKSSDELRQILKRIDHKSYGFYKDLAGGYNFGEYQLFIDHVQGDPFATPSRVRFVVERKFHQFPSRLYDEKCKKIALEDYLLRLLNRNIRAAEQRGMGSGKSGTITTCRPGQDMLERTAVAIGDKLEARIEVGFPARGRTILSDEMEKILFGLLPQIAERTFYYARLRQEELDRRMELAVDQQAIAKELQLKKLVAFVADGSILPRLSGVSDLPMKDGIPFTSPESLRVEMNLPYHGRIQGMGIPRGITVITGGGYHGKSTLLRALEAGVYPHIPGDGREYVVTDATALKIRAEDGRCIHHCNISPFISHLPGGQNTDDFITENASGSTSQAANVIEGIEAGAKTLLIDEDTSATNFMIRDALMAKLVTDDKEPITPFIRRIRSLYEDAGISTVIVIGSSGDYLSVADTVLQLDHYRVKDVTARARELCRMENAQVRQQEEPFPQLLFERRLRAGGSGQHERDARGRRDDIKIKTGGRDYVMINHETIDLRYLEQLTDNGQTAALGYMMRIAIQQLLGGNRTVRQVVEHLYSLIEKNGIQSIVPPNYPAGHAVLPRPQEFYQCLNRYRPLK